MANYLVEVNAVFKTYVSVDAQDDDSARRAAYDLANRQMHTGYVFTHYVDRTTWPVANQTNRKIVKWTEVEVVPTPSITKNRVTVKVGE